MRSANCQSGQWAPRRISSNLNAPLTSPVVAEVTGDMGDLPGEGDLVGLVDLVDLVDLVGMIDLLGLDGQEFCVLRLSNR